MWIHVYLSVVGYIKWIVPHTQITCSNQMQTYFCCNNMHLCFRKSFPNTTSSSDSKRKSGIKMDVLYFIHWISNSRKSSRKKLIWSFEKSGIFTHKLLENEHLNLKSKHRSLKLQMRISITTPSIQKKECLRNDCQADYIMFANRQHRFYLRWTWKLKQSFLIIKFSW
jgi:hypothetical protein